MSAYCHYCCTQIDEDDIDYCPKCGPGGFRALPNKKLEEIYNSFRSLKYYINNPSGWERFDQSMSDKIADHVALIDAEVAEMVNRKKGVIK